MLRSGRKTSRRGQGAALSLRTGRGSILPEANRGHFEELPDYLKEGLTVHFAKRYGDVAKVLFPA